MYGTCKNFLTHAFFHLKRPISLKGRIFIEPKDLTNDEIKSLLWTALEIKHLDCKRTLNIDSVRDKHIFLLCCAEKIEFVSLAAAAHLLGSTINKVVKPGWDSHLHLGAKRKFLEKNVDMVFCHSKYVNRIIDMGINSKVPFVSLGSCKYVTHLVLADMITLQEKYGKLKDLNLAWFGKPCCYTNTYLWICSGLGLNVRLFCSSEPDKLVSPLVYNDVLNSASRTGNIKQFSDCKEAANGVDVMIVLAKNSKADGFIITEEMGALASPNYSIIQHGFDSRAIHPNLCHRNLMWMSVENAKYVLAAILLRFIADYEHTTRMPNFDGCSQKS